MRFGMGIGNTECMLRKWLYLIIVFYGATSIAQQCPNLNNPVNGAVNVPVTTTISWDEVEGVPGYIISIGTTPGGTDIINERSVGNATGYVPPLGLPENTEIYVTLTLFFFDLPNITCQSESFRTEAVTSVPPCTSLRNPVDGATNVNVANNIQWNYAPTATSYDLTIGTTPGGGEILSTQNVGNVRSYNPPADFPPSAQIFVTITPRNAIGGAPGCMEQQFTTGVLAVLPGCTSLISPVNGATNVPLTPFIEWTEVPGANGYRVTIGSSPFTAEILDNVLFSTNSTLVIDFEPNRTFFVTIIPFNDAGLAIGCTQESFSTILGCGPYFDVVTGELITLNPEINFPDSVSFCQNEAPFTVTTMDTAEGFRWYKVDAFGDEILLSETASVDLTENGQYRYEAYNTVAQSGGSVECPTTKFFNVVSSEIARITSVNVTGQEDVIDIDIRVEGIGDYEYALDNTDGPYQPESVFNGVPVGSHTVFVRDRNGCGIAEEQIEPDLSLEGFPKFFTPNGDGVNDYWQFIPPPALSEITLNTILIFDRFGVFLAEIDPFSIGWDGKFQGKPLPSSDYWFKASDHSNNHISGHFALKR